MNQHQQTRLGQHFTPDNIVAKMLELRVNSGRVLEPSAGTGAFLRKLEPDTVGIELDASLNDDPRIQHQDFFAYATSNRFDTIIGNPPYVPFKQIRESTKRLLDMALFDCRSNLYLFFIAKCLDHLNDGGELIFITPRDFVKATSARRLNARLFNEGSLTHYFELGDARIFSDATPNCSIWRWVKGLRKRDLETGQKFCLRNGCISFSEGQEALLSDQFDVKVGAVSGADVVFESKQYGCTEMVCSSTVSNGATKKMIYNRWHKSLEVHKETLLKRRIRRFDENNWWEWGRKYCHREGERIYVNTKTRNKNPFFISDVPAYDGSMLALFPKKKLNLVTATEALNQVAWDNLGFKCDGRLLFSQRSLANCPILL